MPRTLLKPDVRRRQLLQAAIQVFAAKGYAAASVADIIAAAGVARGTFYLYFPGKKEIFLSISDEYRHQLEQLVSSLTAPKRSLVDVREQMRANVREWLEFFHRHRDETKIILRETNAIDPDFERKRNEIRSIARAHLVERFRWLQQSGRIRRAPSAEALTFFVMGMLDEVVSSYILQREEPDLDWLADQWAEFEWQGIRPDAQVMG